MKTTLKINLSLFCFYFFTAAYGQPGLDLQPGTDRWNIKISTNNFTVNDKAKNVSLKTLLKLPLIDKKYSKKAYNDVLIPEKVETLKEGDKISTKGYLHLVALERSYTDHQDGDYHIQLTLNPEWSDSCFIVEIPYEEFVSNPELKSLFQTSRKFIRERLLKDENKQPSSGGNIMQHTVYVKVTGQLFYDAFHAGQMGNPDISKRQFRGKRGNSPTKMSSYTAWEIHPVTNIEFAPKPH